MDAYMKEIVQLHVTTVRTRMSLICKAQNLVRLRPDNAPQKNSRGAFCAADSAKVACYKTGIFKPAKEASPAAQNAQHIMTAEEWPMQLEHDFCKRQKQCAPVLRDAPPQEQQPSTASGRPCAPTETQSERAIRSQ